MILTILATDLFIEGTECLRGTSPRLVQEWWEDVVNGYKFLKEEGYEEIAVVGISLGGVFLIKSGN